jgi:hypothetical protein
LLLSPLHPLSVTPFSHKISPFSQKISHSHRKYLILTETISFSQKM